MPRPHPGRAAEIDSLLPQTQCGQCGYAGCMPYAEAVAEGRAEINQCPPGGEEGARDLAILLGMPYLPPDPAFGVAKPDALAVIDEARCIGCTLCIQACPVDAIIGAAKLMHTVIAAECTGCELCLPPCPVDCIAMVPTGRAPTREEKRERAALARRRFHARNARLARLGDERPAKKETPREDDAESIKKATVARAIARARERLQRRKS
jgi:electron transport complex protein RnfB